MLERLEAIEKRYKELELDLLSPEVLSNVKQLRELSIEKSNLEEAYQAYLVYKQILEDINTSKEMLDDPELNAFAKEELKELESKKEEMDSKLEIILLPKDPNDGKNVIVEIRGAAGGDEANIFAGDLYHMYVKYAEKQGWNVEILDENYSENGGFSLVQFMIKGDNVYSKLKYESGSHRVQRVPVTETQGRVHTSTATVLVMPEVEEFDVELNESDIRVDIFRSGGKGGQGVNTTDSAIRLTHIPTGIVVSCQNERSQIKNKEQAMKVLRSRLYESELAKAEAELGSERKNKIGTGDRSEKIRTYNYPQNRVTDHRIGYTTKQLDRVMEGALDEIIDALIQEDQTRKLKGE